MHVICETQLTPSQFRRSSERVNNISPNKIVATTKNIIIIYSPEIYFMIRSLKIDAS